MALVKYGGGIIQMSGSIAGNTHARNRYGNYVRARTKPINPNSEMQNEVRVALAYLTEYWSETLEPADREAWGVYAKNVNMKNKLGEVIHLSGFNHFIRSNANVQRRGESLYTTAPSVYTLPDKDSTLVIEPEVHENKCKMTFNVDMDWVKEDGGWLFINEGVAQNPQRNFFAGPYHGLKDKAGHTDGDGLTSPEFFTSQQTLALGQRVWFRLRIQRADGRISEPWTVQNLVVAGPI